MRNRASVCFTGWLLLANGLMSATASASIVEAIDAVEPKMVKIYGAGGVQGMANYQSGFLISSEGHVLTIFSHVLDTDDLAVVLSDGRRFTAKLVGADPRLETAVLKMDATGLPHFELSRAVPLDAGALVLTLSNMFGVAMGNEPVSVQKGTISTITQLDARRGAYETPYRGPVYVLDVTTNNSGAAGGAVVTREGELAAMLGKELRNTRNNTWLNYAIPIVELRASVEAIRTGKYVATTEDAATRRPARPLNLASLGIDLVPDVLERTPPYVDRVSMGLPAARAGVRPDDLIVMVNDQLIQSCKILRAAVETIDADDPVKITVLRGQTMMEFSLQSANASGSHKEQR